MGFRDCFRTSPDDDREIREEIAFHVDRATQENLATGMGEAEARAEALRRFGDVERVRRECRAARRRRVPAAVSWAAVAALAAVSFLAGYGLRPDGSSLLILPVPAPPPGAAEVAWPRSAPLHAVSEPLRASSLRQDISNALRVQITPGEFRSLAFEPLEVRPLDRRLRLELRTVPGRVVIVEPPQEEKR